MLHLDIISFALYNISLRGQKTLISHWLQRVPITFILCLERTARIAMWVHFGRKPVGLTIYRTTEEEVAGVSWTFWAICGCRVNNTII